ncbi:ANTAR domain-containing protein [Amycolatopsis marina]|uniref:ANTAR domain-containing protein n=1 Tax=Amycolatopsis marina TaxID=490629 RepID=A0A1I0WR88_9PSEU|nr:ANTAR domain-containing protein [Amycolatopsis marina]SFA91121.1 ANTAR domain-containing protein [Amycolatopsis marina]
MGNTTTGDQHGPVAEEPSVRVSELQQELSGLRRALRTRATIEQAMGVLIVAHRCSPQQAFRILVRLSQQHNVKLYKVAQILVRLAARVELEHLEPLLRRAAQNNGAVGPADDVPPEPDSELIESARKLVVAAEENGAARRALVALYQDLVERGWVPPYEVLSRLPGRSE